MITRFSEIKKMKFKVPITPVFNTWGRYFNKVEYIEDCFQKTGISFDLCQVHINTGKELPVGCYR